MPKLYRMLTGGDDASFCHKVTKALAEGWELYGSPSIAYDSASGKTICGQAVIKQSDKAYDPEKPLSDH